MPSRNKDHSSGRGGAFDILYRRAGRFLATFFGLWTLLAGLLSYARIVTAETPPLSWPEIVIIIIGAAAVTVGIAFPLAVGLVEGIPMVLAKLYTDRVREEAREEGREEGLAQGKNEGMQEMLARWQNWNRRRKAAEQAGQPFDEPEPGLDAAGDNHHHSPD